MLDLSRLGGNDQQDLVKVALRRRKSDWDLVVVRRSWEGSRRIEMEGARYMLRMLDGHHMPAVLPGSLKLQGAIRSHGDL